MHMFCHTRHISAGAFHCANTNDAVAHRVSGRPSHNLDTSLLYVQYGGDGLIPFSYEMFHLPRKVIIGSKLSLFEDFGV